MSINGKGDARRPTLVPRDVYTSNWDRTFNKGRKRSRDKARASEEKTEKDD